MMKMIWSIALVLMVPGFIFPEPPSYYVAENPWKGIANRKYDPQSPLDPSSVQRGDIVYLDIASAKDFFQDIHPLISDPYILVSNNFDRKVFAEYQTFLEDPLLFVWIVQGLSVESHPKLVSVPMKCPYQHLEEYTRSLGQKMNKPHLLYVHHTLGAVNSNDVACNAPLRLPFCIYSRTGSHKEFASKAAHAKFALHISSEELDDSFVWDALSLGTFPIVRGSSTDQLYKELPVLVVRDWTELTAEFLEQKYKEMQREWYNWDKLTHSYWEKMVKGLQDLCKGHHPWRHLWTKEMSNQLSDICELLDENKFSTAYPLIQDLLEELSPQERRISQLIERIEVGQKEMAHKVKQKQSQEVPILSFIIPCYNRATVVRETIESIYAQNMTTPFEVIAIDDCSSDQSYQILQEYERLYDNFFAFQNPINQKAPSTRNKAVCYARGAYICNADSDDVFEPKTIQAMFDAMVAKEYDLAFFQELRFFHDHEFDTYCTSASLAPNHAIFLEPMLREQYICVAAGNRIYSKESWLRSGGYLEEAGHDSWSFSYQQIASGYKGYIHPNSSYRHRTWADDSNMWQVEHRQNLHDISPKQAMLEHPELLTTRSVQVISDYVPNQSEFMAFVAQGLDNCSLRLTSDHKFLLEARFSENRGELLTALNHYVNAITQNALLHPLVYLRALRIATQLGKSRQALTLTQHLRLQYVR